MTYKNGVFIASIIAGFMLTALMASTALADCDLSNLACKEEGNKCNIRFKNETGRSSGAGGGTGYKQISLAATIKVTRRAKDGSRKGTIIDITAGASKAVNLDNKKFVEIKIHRETGRAMKTGNETTKLACEDIKKVLKGNGSCRVFAGKTHGRVHTVVKCDGGNVIVPSAHDN